MGPGNELRFIPQSEDLSLNIQEHIPFYKVSLCFNYEEKQEYYNGYLSFQNYLDEAC